MAEGLPAGVELWGKAEFLNPSGSVKDRAAERIVADALEAGELGPGRTLVDATSGNTGVAYARLGALHGFRVELFVPRSANPERVARMRAHGAQVHVTDPLEGTDGAQREAQERAESSPTRYFYADQYRNPSNPLAHYRSTGPEIWMATAGRVTHFVAGVGTGGTISGTGRFLKEQNPAIRVVAVEPATPMHGIEGLKHLPSSRVPSTYDPSVVDRTIRVTTESAIRQADRLREREHLNVGASAGAAVGAALRLGRRLTRGVVVVILPDGDGSSGEEIRRGSA